MDGGRGARRRSRARRRRRRPARRARRWPMGWAASGWREKSRGRSRRAGRPRIPSCTRGRRRRGAPRGPRGRRASSAPVAPMATRRAKGARARGRRMSVILSLRCAPTRACSLGDGLAATGGTRSAEERRSRGVGPRRREEAPGTVATPRPPRGPERLAVHAVGGGPLGRMLKGSCSAREPRACSGTTWSHDGGVREAAEAAMRREVCARERRVPPLESEREAKRRGALGVVASS